MRRVSRLIPALVAASLALAACDGLPGLPGAPASGQPDGAPVGERVRVQQGAIENRIIATGNVVARATATLTFRTSGEVKSILVKEGDQVKAGQPLATLDTHDLELTAQQQYANYLNARAAYSQTIKGPSELELKSAKASLSSAQAAYGDLFKDPTENELTDLKAQLANAEAQLKQAQFNYDSAAKRDPAGAPGTSQAVSLEQATNSYFSAKAKYDAAFDKPANASVASAAAQIASARAQLDALNPTTETIEQAKTKLDQAYLSWVQAEDSIQNATMIAPFDGMITAVAFDVGDWASTGSATIDIADFDEPIFEVSVDEVDLGSVEVGQEARIHLQTYPDQPIGAKVESVATVGTNDGNIVTYKVKLVIPGGAGGDAKRPRILLGMSGTSEIITAKADDALLVPNRALAADGQTRSYSVLRLKQDGTPERVPVKIGLRDADNTQIVEGLKAGDVLLVQTIAAQQSNSGGATFGPAGGAPPGGGPFAP